jgi:hypothetical protein
MAESPVSSNCTGSDPTINSRARLFPDIPKTTVIGGMFITGITIIYIVIIEILQFKKKES